MSDIPNEPNEDPFEVEDIPDPKINQVVEEDLPKEEDLEDEPEPERDVDVFSIHDTYIPPSSGRKKADSVIKSQALLMSYFAVYLSGLNASWLKKLMRFYWPSEDTPNYTIYDLAGKVFPATNPRGMRYIVQVSNLLESVKENDLPQAIGIVGSLSSSDDDDQEIIMDIFRIFLDVDLEGKSKFSEISEEVIPKASEYDTECLDSLAGVMETILDQMD